MALLGLLVLGLAPASARAQSIDAKLFDPVLDPYGVLGVPGSRSLPHLSFSVSLTASYANDLLVAQTPVTRFSPLRHRLAGEIGFALGFFDRLQLGVALPVYLHQTSEADTVSSASDAGVGDVRIEPKLTMVANRCTGSFGVALLTPFTVPSGKGGPFMGDRSATFTPQVAFDYCRAGGLLIALAASYRVRASSKVRDLTIGSELRLALGADVPLGVAGLSVLGEASLAIDIASAPDDPDFDSRKVPVELRGGLRWRHRSGLSATAAIGAGVTRAYGAPDVRAVLRVAYAFGATRARPHRRVEARQPDKRRARTVTEKLQPRRDIGFKRFDALAAADPDPDGDGIPSSVDRCPRAPEDRDGFEDDDGCPDPDNDGDGILDKHDKCPLHAEVVNGIKDDDGCPDKGSGRVQVRRGVVQVNQTIFFKTGSDVLEARSLPLLKEVAAVLRQHREIKRVRVEGHTDDRGDKEMNVDLSERRARRVLEYLVKRGVARQRLEAKGYGWTRPLTSNKTKQGRAKNRRVLLRILERAKPSGKRAAMGKVPR